MPLRILLVDDHELVRLGLKAVLGCHADLEVVGAVGTGTEAIREIARLSPDLVLLDVRLPDLPGHEVCFRIRELPRPPKVVILTSFAEEDVVEKCLSAGADGFLLKEVESDALVEAIRRVAEGELVLHPSVSAREGGGAQTQAPEQRGRRGLDVLSHQERRVIALVAEGKTNKEIAAAMGLSDKTVKNYFSNILDKLHMTRRSQAAAYYVQQTR